MKKYFALAAFLFSSFSPNKTQAVDFTNDTDENVIFLASRMHFRNPTPENFKLRFKEKVLAERERRMEVKARGTVSFEWHPDSSNYGLYVIPVTLLDTVIESNELTEEASKAYDQNLKSILVSPADPTEQNAFYAEARWTPPSYNRWEGQFTYNGNTLEFSPVAS